VKKEELQAYLFNKIKNSALLPSFWPVSRYDVYMNEDDEPLPEF